MGVSMVWQHCYSEGWVAGVDITAASFAHPAKASKVLLRQIIVHMLTKGWLQKNDIVGDPFFGVGTAGIVGAYAGLRVMGVEIEERFYLLVKDNFALHRRKWNAMGLPVPVVIQGDSRKFHELIGQVQGVISSPPYAANEKSDYLFSEDRKTRQRDERRGYQQGKGCFRGSETYGETGGQIGVLPTGNLSAIISSPPYEAAQTGGGIVKTGSFSHPNGTPKSGGWSKTGGYQSDMQGDSPGQIGNEQKENYWTAMKAVWASCYLALKPGGVLACIVKPYVRDKKIVDLPTQTLTLLNHLGFEALEVVHAALVEEARTNGLFGEEVKTKARKSFFRRLYEQKYPENAIDYESVLFVRKPV